MTRRMQPVAWGASAAVVLGSPLIGDLRLALLRAVPKYYVAIISGAVVLGAAFVLGACLRRIREDRVRRAGALVLSVALALVSFAVLRSGNPNVDAVEAFHFVEYSVLTLLFFRFTASGPRWEAYANAAAASAAVAVADEWFQWFVPGRAGELHDVLFDLVAIGCGLLLCLALDGRGAVARGAGSVATGGRRGLALGLRGALVILLLGAFIATIHLGSEIRDPEVGVFRSRFTGARLIELGNERWSDWAGGPPPTVGPYGREDQYLAEALWHVRRRNFGMDVDRKGDTVELDIAWHENRILETYFRAVLEAPPAPGTTGHRLAAEQIATLEASRAHGPAPFVSDAQAAPIYIWPPIVFWPVVLALATAAAAAGVILDLARRRGGTHA